MRTSLLYRSWALAIAMGFMLNGPLAHAQSTGSRDASGKVSMGVASILISPVASVAGSTNGKTDLGSVVAVAGASFVVTGIVQLSAETAEVIIDSVNGAAKISVQVASSALRGMAVSVGTAVRAVAASTGTILVVSGKVLAFIPNAVGQTLIHHARVPE